MASSETSVAKYPRYLGGSMTDPHYTEELETTLQDLLDDSIVYRPAATVLAPLGPVVPTSGPGTVESFGGLSGNVVAPSTVGS
jgi:hypothetical protein